MTLLYRMVISVLIVAIICTHHAIYGSASKHHQPAQLVGTSTTDDPSRQTELLLSSSSNETLQKEVDSREADHFAELGSCGTDKDALLKEMETVRGEVRELTEALEEAQTLAEKAAVADATQKERDEAARLAAEQAVDEVAAIKATAVDTVPEAEVDHPAGGGMETCVDVSQIEKECKDLQTKLAAAEERLPTLQKEVDSREADHFAELGSCGTDKDALLEEVEAVRGEVRELTEALKEAQALAEKAAAEDATQKERDEAARLAAEQQSRLTSEFGTLEAEVDDLQRELSWAKAKALEAWKEVEKHADGKNEIRRKLERTASELEIARNPRKISVSAILADLRYLFDELVRQSADARDGIVFKGTVLSEKKWAEIIPQNSKIALQFWEKWQPLFEVDLHRRLINAGLSKDQADKVTKYAYFGVMATVAVILLFYLVKLFLSYVVIPLVRTVLRWALWLIYLPIHILLVWPVMLMVWLLTCSFGLVFGRGSKPPASKMNKGRATKATAKGKSGKGKAGKGKKGKGKKGKRKKGKSGKRR